MSVIENTKEDPMNQLRVKRKYKKIDKNDKTYLKMKKTYMNMYDI